MRKICFTMMNKLSGKWWIFFVSLMATTASVQACIWFDVRDYHHTLLDYYMLRQCYPEQFFYWDRFAGKPCPEADDFPHLLGRGRGSDLNLRAWKEGLSAPDLPEADMALVVYRLSEATLQALLAQLEAGSQVLLPDSLQDNRFLQMLIKDQRTDVLQYLHYAKQCEPFALNEADDWAENQPAGGKQVMQKLIMKGAEGYAATPELWLKQRYAYQMVRMAFLMGDYNLVTGLYAQTVTKDMPHNYIYGRTLGRMAGALRWLGQLGKAKYHFGILYMHMAALDPNFAVLAYKNFRYIDHPTDKDWTDCIALARNGAERNVLWILRSLENNYEERGSEAFRFQLAGLQQALAEDASSNASELLLLLEIQKLEQHLFKPMLYRRPAIDSVAYTADLNIGSVESPVQPSFWKRFWLSIKRFFSGLFSSRESYSPVAGGASRVSYLSMEDWYRGYEINKDSVKTLEQATLLLNLIDSTLQKRQVAQPAFWQTMAAYVCLMQQDWGKASGYLVAARKAYEQQAGQQPTIVRQVALLEAYIALNTRSQIDEVAETDLYRFVSSRSDSTPAFDQVFFNRLGQRYLAEGQLGRSVLAYHKAYLAQEIQRQYFTDYYSYQEDEANTPPLVKGGEVVAVLLDMYASDEELDELIAFIQKEGGSNWEQLLKEGFLSVHQLLEVKATRLARNNHFALAVAALDEIPASYWHTDALEFAYSMQSVQERRQQTNSYRLSTKPVFFRLIDSLQRQAISRPQASETYTGFISIGNALYSTPYWAYNHHLWNQNLISTARYFSGNQYPLNINSDICTRLYQRKQDFMVRYGTGLQAAAFYRRAAASPDKEIAARAAFLGLQASTYPLTTFHDAYYANDAETFRQILKEHLANPALAAIIRKECPGIDRFLR
jgi:hypothetical protein